MVCAADSDCSQLASTTPYCSLTATGCVVYKLIYIEFSSQNNLLNNKEMFIKL